MKRSKILAILCLIFPTLTTPLAISRTINDLTAVAYINYAYGSFILLYWCFKASDELKKFSIWVLSILLLSFLTFFTALAITRTYGDPSTFLLLILTYTSATSYWFLNAYTWLAEDSSSSPLRVGDSMDVRISISMSLTVPSSTISDNLISFNFKPSDLMSTLSLTFLTFSTILVITIIRTRNDGMTLAFLVSNYGAFILWFSCLKAYNSRSMPQNNNKSPIWILSILFLLFHTSITVFATMKVGDDPILFSGLLLNYMFKLLHWYLEAYKGKLPASSHQQEGLQVSNDLDTTQVSFEILSDHQDGFC